MIINGIAVDKEDMHTLLKAIIKAKEHVESHEIERALFILDVLEINLSRHLLEDEKGMD